MPIRPLHHEVVVVKNFTHHQDAFIHDLQNEVNELRMRQGDMIGLTEQFRYLQDQYKALQIDKQHFENDCLAKISEDRQQVDALIREFDGLKAENDAVEKEQGELLEQVFNTETEVHRANQELASTRHDVSACDSANLNLRKEIEHVEALVHDQKEVNHANYGELCRLRDASYGLDRDIDHLRKTVSVARADLENNDNRLATMQEIVAQKDHNLHVVHNKIADAHQHIQELKYTLNKLDGELGYFEAQNEQHKGAQQ